MSPALPLYTYTLKRINLFPIRAHIAEFPSPFLSCYASVPSWLCAPVQLGGFASRFPLHFPTAMTRLNGLKPLSFFVAAQSSWKFLPGPPPQYSPFNVVFSGLTRNSFCETEFIPSPLRLSPFSISVCLRPVTDSLFSVLLNSVPHRQENFQ